MGFLLFLWLFSSAACALFTALAARGKGYKDSSWGIVGFIFGPLGLLAIAACPDLRSRRLLRIIAESQVDVTEKLSRFDAPEPKYSGEGGMVGEMLESLLINKRD